MTLCLASCLPVYLPILFGYGDDVKKGAKLALGFAVGRFIGYFTLGLIAALLGRAFFDFFNRIFPKFSIGIIFLFGLLTIFYSSLLFAKVEIFENKACKAYMKNTKNFNSPFFASGSLGFVSTITPCVPVFTFLLLPFAIGKIFDTTMITIAFGLGANIIFLVIGILVAFGMKNFKEKFAKFRRLLEIFSAITLLIFGLFYVIWSIGPLFFNWKYDNFVMPTILDFWSFIRYLFRI
jgi:cytochrome c biogenesis protein CcdA